MVTFKTIFNHTSNSKASVCIITPFPMASFQFPFPISGLTLLYSHSQWLFPFPPVPIVYCYSSISSDNKWSVNSTAGKNKKLKINQRFKNTHAVSKQAVSNGQWRIQTFCLGGHEGRAPKGWGCENFFNLLL